MHHPSHRGIANFINPNSRWFVIGFTSVAAFIYAGSLGYFMGINISQQYMMGPSENGWHISQLQPIGIGNTLFADKPIFCVFTWVQNLFFFQNVCGCFLVKSFKELLHLFVVGTHLDMYDKYIYIHSGEQVQVPE